MIAKKDLIKINDYLWEIPKTYRDNMRVPARVYSTEKILDKILQDRSLEQLINVATLPGILAAMAMPDAHEGYGFPIGGVGVFEYKEGVISPGGIGYDINCGVRLLSSHLSYENIKPFLGRLAKELYREVPSGVGKGGSIKLNKNDLDLVLKEGVGFLVKKGYVEKDDLLHIESSGVLANANPSNVSHTAKQRGQDQLGTMGGGNHFVEVDRVDEIFDEEVAKSLYLSWDQIVVLIHTGSRGLGHQVATDYIRLMLSQASKYGVNLVDRELACVPFNSKEGGLYFSAMKAAANFAWSNRQIISYEVRKVFKNMFGENNGQLKLVYDVAHNIAKVEEHMINDRKTKVIVHRKGATRAFPTQPVLIPGSMGTASYVLSGTKEAMLRSFGSCCHGAGRVMSRHAAKQQIQGKKLLKELLEKGIHIAAGSYGGLAEEAPLAYKDIEEVVEVVSLAGIAKKVARLKPVVVVKG